MHIGVLPLWNSLYVAMCVERNAAATVTRAGYYSCGSLIGNVLPLSTASGPFC